MASETRAGGARSGGKSFRQQLLAEHVRSRGGRAVVMSRQELQAAGVQLGPNSPLHQVKKRAAPRDLEGAEQRALFQWIEETGKHHHPELELLYAVPNGGKRGIRTAVRMKAEGVKAGVPDLVLPVARGGYFGLYLELKADESLRPIQKQWLAALAAEGYRACMVRGEAAAREELLAYLRQPPTKVT